MGTIADKLAKLNTTKEELKAALAEKGQTVGEVFSAYPAAVRAIEAGSSIETATVTVYNNATGFYPDPSIAFGIYDKATGIISVHSYVATKGMSATIQNVAKNSVIYVNKAAVLSCSISGGYAVDSGGDYLVVTDDNPEILVENS